MEHQLFHEIALLLLLAALVGLVGNLLRQPLIVSFIAVGILAGAVLDSTPEAVSQIKFLSELGVSLLLFLVGLKLDLRLIKSLGTVSLATGLGQVVFTAGAGWLIGLALGMGSLESFYVAVALTFSSTIIIIKLLTDKRELDTLHGRIALGFLIVQDIVVVIAMVVLSAYGVGKTGEGSIGAVLFSILGIVAGLYLFIRFFAEKTLLRFAGSPELMVIFAISWAIGGSALGDYLGLGKELGGLAAGVSLGSTSYREILSARLNVLRDFLLLFFFLSIGLTLDLSTIGDESLPALIFSGFVLVGNPLIVVLIMALMGYRARTGFLCGLTVAQISEFSLIFIAMGRTIGHVEDSAVGLVTLVGLVTIAISVYMITYSHELYAFLRPLLRPFDFGKRGELENPLEGDPPEVLLFGMGRFGRHLYEQLVDGGFSVAAFDLDPRLVVELKKKGYEVRYGDVTEPEFLEHLPLSSAKFAILAVPFGSITLQGTDPGLSLLSILRTKSFSGQLVVVARSDRQGELLAGSGVDLVLYPFEAAARDAVERLRSSVGESAEYAPK